MIANQIKCDQREHDAEELFAASEIIDFGGHFCRPVDSINGVRVGQGKHLVYEAVATALRQDMVTNESMLDDVPYDDYSK